MNYQICVSGSSRGIAVEKNAALAYEVGKAIARAGCTLMTGATVGLPEHAARGAQAAKGQSIGISPAATRLEHTKKYNLPTDCFDYILFTGLHYIGRDALLISSSDAVITIGGRMGTLHEFSIAIELDKPTGVISGSGGTSEWFDELIQASGIRKLAARNIIYDNDPNRIVKRILKVLQERELEEPTVDELSLRA